MSNKRPPSPVLIPNPFIKKRNLTWTLETSDIDSTQFTSQALPENSDQNAREEKIKTPSNAAIEAGQICITNHLDHFSATLSSHILPSLKPLLSIPSYRSLYTQNADSFQGAHFVIHQHDHPIAGTHYDLRLQINPSSSASWAIMYGLPGDPNSHRLNRNATETRVHCLWNHLVEMGSRDTGSLVIWDTGRYEVLERRSKYAPREDPDSQQEKNDDDVEEGSNEKGKSAWEAKTQQERLSEAFRNRKIKLRLYGSKLPERYVLNLRLTKSEDAQGRARSGRKPKFKRKGGGRKKKVAVEEIETDSGSDRRAKEGKKDAQNQPEKEGSVVDEEEECVKTGDTGPEATSAMERELRELEDEEVRRTNAYPGAENTIGSVHQRRWYLSLDRTACGFVKRGRRWVEDGKGIGEEDAKPNSVGRDGKARREEDVKMDSEEGGDGKDAITLDMRKDAARGGIGEEGYQRLRYPFYIYGSAKERSVVTGRMGRDVLQDEGVEGFVQRRGWKAVVN